MNSTHSASMSGGGSGADAPVASATQPGAAHPFEAVLALVGDGRWRTVEFDVMPHNEGTLLEALAESRAFKNKLRDVDLSDCTVTMCTSASDEGPSAAEESGAKELKGAKTLGALAGGMLTATLPYLYIRVALPAGGEYPCRSCARRQ